MKPADANRLFYSLIWPHRAMILRTAKFLTRNDAEADDLAQETLVKAFKSMDQYDARFEAGGRGAKGWLSAILRNLWIDRLRRSGKHANDISLEHEEIDMVDSRGPVASGATDAASLLDQFSDSDLVRALKTLPAEICWTLLLVDVESMGHAQAAAVLDVPEGTVKSRAHRGRRMLRELLESKGAAAHSAAGLEDLP